MPTELWVVTLKPITISDHAPIIMFENLEKDNIKSWVTDVVQNIKQEWRNYMKHKFQFPLYGKHFHIQYSEIYFPK